jgi:hypothetical protein
MAVALAVAAGCRSGCVAAGGLLWL